MSDGEWHRLNFLYTVWRIENPILIPCYLSFILPFPPEIALLVLLLVFGACLARSSAQGRTFSVFDFALLVFPISLCCCMLGFVRLSLEVLKQVLGARRIGKRGGNIVTK